MNKDLDLIELPWSQARVKIREVNAEFVDLVDAIGPDDSFTIFFAKYPYGSQILKNGKMYFPSKHGPLIGFHDARMDPRVREMLGYAYETNPVSMVLEKSLDLYIPTEDRNVLFGLIEPGVLFGVWHLFERLSGQSMTFTPVSIWDMTAGARSIFALPKLSDAVAFQRLQHQFDLEMDPPQNLEDQWNIFKAIANHPKFEEPWMLEIAFFPVKWAEAIHLPKWYALKDHAAYQAWRGSSFWRNQFCWDLTFSRIQGNREIKPAPYFSDIVAHLFALSAGAAAGLRPMTTSKAAPIKGLMRALESIYRTPYAPILMGPDNFSVFDPNATPIYYSYQYPTAIKLSEAPNVRHSILDKLYHTRALLNKYLHDLQIGDLKIEGSALYEIAKLIEVNFCHSSGKEPYKMMEISHIINTDPNFQKALALCENKAIAPMPACLNGCVQIQRKIIESQ